MQRLGSMRRFAAVAVIALVLLPAAASAELPPVGGKVVVASTATIKPNSALIRVFCNGPRACEVTLELVATAQARGGGQAEAKSSAAAVLLGTTSFRLEPGASRILRLELSPGGKRLLESGSPVKARVRGSGLHPHAVKLKRAVP